MRISCLSHACIPSSPPFSLHTYRKAEANTIGSGARNVLEAEEVAKEGGTEGEIEDEGGLEGADTASGGGGRAGGPFFGSSPPFFFCRAARVLFVHVVL